MLHCTGVGKALLGRMQRDEIQALVARTGLPPSTAHTMTTAEAVVAEAAATGQRGYSFDSQENELGNFCIGAAFNDASGKAIGACSVAGTDPEIVRAARGEDRAGAGGGLCSDLHRDGLGSLASQWLAVV